MESLQAPGCFLGERQGVDMVQHRERIFTGAGVDKNDVIRAEVHAISFLLVRALQVLALERLLTADGTRSTSQPHPCSRCCRPVILGAYVKGYRFQWAASGT